MLLKTFGGLTIAVSEGEPQGAAAQRRRLALLALLAATGERGMTREKVIGYLWPESGEERSRAALAQALYALRKDLGSEDVVEGTATLKLNESVLPSDVGRFRRALAENRFADAAALYAGPFLDGVHIAEAEEFSRWADEERRGLAREAADAFEKAAAAAAASGDHGGAVSWWRRRAALDPLESRAALGLMQALAATGDRSAALQHARIYQTLVQDQLGVTPDPAIRELVEKLKAEPAPVVPSVRQSVSPSVLPYAEISEPEPVPSPPDSAQRRKEISVLVGIGAVIASLIIVLARKVPEPAPPPAAPEILAVGAFRAYGAGARELASPLTDMLATNLASAPGLTVLSSARLFELAGAGGTDTAGLMRAARTAGATTLLDGAVYAQGDSVRLDVRRTDLAAGTVSQAVSVKARDVFTAVDLATAHLLRSLGKAAPERPIAAVTTRSIVAYRLYVEGLDAWSADRREAAHALFASAVEEDSTFAMAEHYAALSSSEPNDQSARIRRATRLAERASDRERLLIRWHWANFSDELSSMPLSESLVTRFAAEPFAHIAYGRALIQAGRFIEAVPHFRMALEKERGRGLDITPGACIRCEARLALAHAYRLADSVNSGLRELRQWTRDEPRLGQAWDALADLLFHLDRYEEALAAAETARELGHIGDLGIFRTRMQVRRGEFAAADAALRNILRSGNADQRGEALWYLTFSYRAQGRLRDAMETARALRSGGTAFGQRGVAPYDALQQATVLYEGGRYREAAALYDSIALLRVPTETASRHARHATWLKTLSATARAAAGDTASLAALADSIEMLSRGSAYGRDHRLHHHVRGLLLAARGQHLLAAESYRRAIYSPVVGYTRTNVELAKALVAAGRPQEAIRPLQAALRGPIDGPNTHVSRTELHEQIALAFAAAGQADSAEAHAREAGTAWRAADQSFLARRQAMERLYH